MTIFLDGSFFRCFCGESNDDVEKAEEAWHVIVVWLLRRARRLDLDTRLCDLLHVAENITILLTNYLLTTVPIFLFLDFSNFVESIESVL